MYTAPWNRSRMLFTVLAANTIDDRIAMYVSAFAKFYPTISRREAKRALGHERWQEKELVFRAVQIASGSPVTNGARLGLTDDHFATALHDMTNGSGQAAQKIIGFRMDVDR